jgi:hypothetical protein
MVTIEEITIDVYRSQYNDLQKLKKYHMEQLSELSKRIVEIKLKAIKEKWGVYPGCVVKEINSGKLYKVSDIQIKSDEDFDYEMKYNPWIEGHPMKKDGTFSTAKRNVYRDWEVVEVVQE